jgi:hypothetical protein
MFENIQFLSIRIQNFQEVFKIFILSQKYLRGLPKNAEFYTDAILILSKMSRKNVICKNMGKSAKNPKNSKSA